MGRSSSELLITQLFGETEHELDGIVLTDALDVRKDIKTIKRAYLVTKKDV